ncbi:hypothetical protein VNI00_002265 [Paramarasmius palmivorus]|uniref:Cytochrome P450 n=1 Tax=Paramarasmius palmivorus TaxID=297713 RepID=A0AAW0E3T3_9AGAR
MSFRAQRAGLDDIPTVGYDGFLTSYISAFHFIIRGGVIIQEGYRKFPGKAFKIALPDRWLVIVTGQRMIQDIRKASDNVLSFSEAAEEVAHEFIAPRSLQMLIYYVNRNTIGKIIRSDPWHFDIVRGTLTKKIASKFPEIHDEMIAAFADELPVSDDWIEVPIERAAHRIRLNIQYTQDLMSTAGLLIITPKFLQSLVGWLASPRRWHFPRAHKLLRPVILERFEMLRKPELEHETPDDFLTWLIKNATTNERADPENVTTAVLSTNIAAILTTVGFCVNDFDFLVLVKRPFYNIEYGRFALAFTHALVDLASHPELIGPLRCEVEEVLAKDGWTKTAMGNMLMLDSFLMESQRVSNSNPFGLLRKSLCDFIFSDGTVVPEGTFIATAPRALHFDESHYIDPNHFDGLRFQRLREEFGNNFKYRMVTPGDNWLSFGAGRHSCPGRFFAVNELKALVSYTLLKYDIKVDDLDKSKRLEFAGRIATDPTSRLLLRNRV